MTTSHRNLQLPEPALPEHVLIRDCAPTPRLSSGFRARVMAECTVSIVHARRIRRWKIAGTLAAACALCLLVAVSLPNQHSAQDNVAAPTSAPETQAPEPASVPSYPSSSSHLAGDRAPTTTKKKSEKTEVNEVIEGLEQRQQLFDAGMLPRFR